MTKVQTVQPDVKPVVPQVAEAPLYPCIEGFTAQYSETSATVTNKSTIVVKDAVITNGIQRFSLIHNNDTGVVLTEKYRIDAAGIWRTATGIDGTALIDPPMLIVPYPVKAGMAWSWTGRLIDSQGPVMGSAKFLIDGPETVRGSTGACQAYRIAQRFTLGPPGEQSVVVNTQWLSPGIGLVRQETDDGSTNTVTQITKWHTPTPTVGGAPK